MFTARFRNYRGNITLGMNKWKTPARACLLIAVLIYLSMLTIQMLRATLFTSQPFLTGSTTSNSLFQNISYANHTGTLGSVHFDRFGCISSAPIGLYRHPTSFQEVEVPLRATDVGLHVFSPGGSGTDRIVEAIGRVGLDTSSLVAESCMCRNCRWCNCLKHRVAHDSEAYSLKLKAAIFFLPDPVKAMASLFRRNYTQFQIDILSEQRCWQKEPIETLEAYISWRMLPNSEDVFDWMGLLDRVLRPKAYKTLVIKTEFFEKDTFESAKIICSFLEDSEIYIPETCIDDIGTIESKNATYYDPDLLEITRGLYTDLLKRIDTIPDFYIVPTNSETQLPTFESDPKIVPLSPKRVRPSLQAFELDSQQSEIARPIWANRCPLLSLNFEKKHADFVDAYGKLVVIEVAKGLQMRLLAISFVKDIAEQSNRTLYVSWKRDEQCNAPMNAFLDPREHFEWRYPTEPDTDRFDMYSWDHLMNRKINVSSSKHIFIHFNSFTHHTDWDFFSDSNRDLFRRFQSIKYSKVVQKLYSKAVQKGIQLNMDANNWVAVHSRSFSELETSSNMVIFDFPTPPEAFFGEMNAIMKSNNKTVFLVAAEDVLSANAFRDKYGSNVYILRSECRRNQRDTSCLQAALIEFLVLMRCGRMLGSSWSPTSRMIGRLGFLQSETKFLPEPNINSTRTSLILSPLPRIGKNFEAALQSNEAFSVKAPFGIHELRHCLSELNGQVKKLDLVVIRPNLVDSYAELLMNNGRESFISQWIPIFHVPSWNISEAQRVLAYLIDYDAMLNKLEGLKLLSFVKFYEVDSLETNVKTDSIWQTFQRSFQLSLSNVEDLRRHLQRKISSFERSVAMKGVLSYLLHLPPNEIPFLPSLNTFRDMEHFKIVGLSQVRNEERRIEEFLKMMSKYVDEVLLLDDDSFDRTAYIATQLGAKVMNRSALTNLKDKGFKVRENENAHNFLLNWARERGATHVVLLDSDQLLMDGLSHNNLLRTLMINLDPGDAIKLQVLYAYMGHSMHIKDATFHASQQSLFAMPEVSYPTKEHISRVPGMESKIYDLTMLGSWYGIVDFKFFNSKNRRADTSYNSNELGQDGETNMVEPYASYVPYDVVLESLPAWTYSSEQRPHYFYLK